MKIELSKWEELAPSDQYDDYSCAHHDLGQCPVEDWLTFLGHKWSALILWQLSADALGFSAVMSALPGITAKVLTERLAGFVERGLIIRTSTTTFPRRTIYNLTDKGREVSQMLAHIYQWSR